MQQPLTKKEYAEFVEKTSPNSKAMSACMGAFLVGGLICALGQGLASLYIRGGMAADTAAGPVIVYGYSAGILYGLLLFLFGLY
jgi:stage V sporulation protein AC